MKLYIGILTLVLALIISCVAAYFSVAGLVAIFPAAIMSVGVMGASLEAGKLVAAGWLHGNWSNPKVHKLHKTYLISAVIVLMAITDLGIYGFLAKAHLEQESPVAAVEINISQKQARVDQINADLQRLNARQSQVDSAVDAAIGKDAFKALKARKSLSSESAEIRAKIDADNKELNDLNTELAPLKVQVSGVETKLGPIKFFGQLFGLKDTEGAVRIVILMLMFVFDPLAVVLLISGTISISDWIDAKSGTKRATAGRIEIIEPESTEEPEPVSVEPEPAPVPVFVADPVPSFDEITPQMLQEELPVIVDETEKSEQNDNILMQLEEVSAREKLLQILEREPELLQNIVEAVRESSPANEEKAEDKQTVVKPDHNESWLGGH